MPHEQDIKQISELDGTVDDGIDVLVRHLSPEVTVVCGDCLTVDMPKADAVISDPPYGMNWNGKVTRGKNGTGKKGPTRHHGETITNDNEQFDPEPWLRFPIVVLFGHNHFAQRLPVGTTLVWLKRYDQGFGSFLSDAEVAWMKGGHGVYCIRDVSLQGESSNRAHPMQKPVGVMVWCMERAKVPDDGLVLDPYMGSGTTGIACIRTGRRFFGVEIDQRYFDAACERLACELAQGRLF